MEEIKTTLRDMVGVTHRSYRGVTREMLEKLRTGDPISDEELNNMLSFLRVLELMLEVMPPEYGLFLRAVRLDVNTLQDFKDARKRWPRS